MKLELKHIVPYLPHGLKGFSSNGMSTTIDELIGIYSDFSLTLKTCVNNHNSVDYECGIDEFKPILRNLSDLTKEIEHNGEKFVPMEKLEFRNRTFMKDCGRYDFKNIEKYGIVPNFFPYWIVQNLFEWHIDFQNLISQGLAIDINTLK